MSPPAFQLGLPQSRPSGGNVRWTPEQFPLLLPHFVELHLFRHGESAANAGKLVTGFMNVPLTKLGRSQARQVGRRLSVHYDLAFSSTLFRSQETLMLALKARKLEDVEVRVNADLAERELGDLELQPARHIPEYSSGNLLYAPKGGESYHSVTMRMLRFLSELAEYIKSEREKDRKIRRVLICTHMGPMRIVAGILSEAADPARVLARSFVPTQLSVFHISRIPYPRFLSAQENPQVDYMEDGQRTD